ncbi:hypothetical protein O6D92_20130, partial [Cronobacter sakazakii]|nr:hypothetical protein [Cronobacter sakazakii]MCZ6149065.1 hypothetical protein [Cronobacter sakazakii]MCZ6154930.1 hypothetical protein [Cronobacter sakazakii]MCZ6412362.1 hypothetical protein [Cronobacter sakazakii]
HRRLACEPGGCSAPVAGYSACLTSFTSSIRFSLHAYGVPDEGQEAMGININAVHYLPGKAAFIALKNTDSHGKIEITRMNKSVSHPFNTAGLRDALENLNWEDCISH